MNSYAKGAVGAVGLFVLAGLGAAALVYSGIYDIGADAPHTPVVTKAIDTLRERSVEVRADDILVPDLTGQHMIAEGAEHYAAMCTGCHLAPGLDKSEIRSGLYPQPPNLVLNPVDDPKQAFWIIKHGVKMSAMPAWGGSHRDADIWNIVAFLKQMPTMSEADYRALITEPEQENKPQPRAMPDDPDHHMHDGGQHHHHEGE
jgi:mono/diheme cytochrome c family protein